MEWSPQQQRALDLVGRWLQRKDLPVFQLAGYAGTGKTTLAKHLVSSVAGRVYFAAYTGKAAYVLRRAGAQNVSTIHKLIYVPTARSKERLRSLQKELAQLLDHVPRPDTLIAKIEKAIEQESENAHRPAFALNSDSDLNGAALVVLDEYSQVNEQMGEDLMSFGVPVLALGDPAQLPPVRGSSYFSGKPDYSLTEIHRQARDNPIIRMATDVREGRALKPGMYGESRVMDYDRLRGDELREMVLKTSQLLVGRNATRISSNRRVRDLLGRLSELPNPGDKLVCLRNNHELGILNGQLWTAEDYARKQDDSPFLWLSLRNDEDERVELEGHPDYFMGGTPSPWTLKDAESFDYGYALTVHKAQGSQWDDLLLFDEWYGTDRRKWLYTAITRAAQRIDVVQM